MGSRLPIGGFRCDNSHIQQVMTFIFFFEEETKIRDSKPVNQPKMVLVEK